MNDILAYNILAIFTEITGVKTTWKPVKAIKKQQDFDGQIHMELTRGNKILFAAIKKSVNLPHMPAIIKLHDLHNDMVVMAEKIFPEARKYLKIAGVNYLDAAGNAYIKGKNLFIMLEGNKVKEYKKDYKVKPFSKTGLKVIFQLLLNERLINATIREIAEEAEVSLDTVHKTINGLKQLKYLLPLSKDKLIWNNKNLLLEKWMAEYETRLKPTLKLGNFRFLSDEEFYHWKDLKLDNQLTRWGGEAAGEILTNYLKPERLTLYTLETKPALIKKLQIIPDPKGYIELYEKFWKQHDADKNTVPPILAYTDLVNSGDRRSVETASKIYEQYLQNKP